MRIEAPVPVTDDPDTAGFFEAARRGHIGVLFCDSCDTPLHLPVPYCEGCGSWEVAWRDVAPTGHVYSYSVVEQSMHPAFEAPYTVVLVELDEVPGVRLIGHLAGRAAIDIGSPLVASFDEERDGVVLPRWQPVT
jgi:uncharacterized OB-fold protein